MRRGIPATRLSRDTISTRCHLLLSDNKYIKVLLHRAIRARTAETREFSSTSRLVAPVRSRQGKDEEASGKEGDARAERVGKGTTEGNRGIGTRKKRRDRERETRK